MNKELPDDLPTAAVVVTVLPASGHKLQLDADEKEREAIARYLEVMAVKSLRVDLNFARWHKEGVKVTGLIRAQLQQQCVVSLEPVETVIREGFEALFVPEGSRLARPQAGPDGELVLDPQGADIPDPFTGDELDAWAIVLEHLQLFIDPFVRMEGVEFETFSHTEDETPAREAQTSPFAVLKSLKNPKRD